MVSAVERLVLSDVEVYPSAMARLRLTQKEKQILNETVERYHRARDRHGDRIVLLRDADLPRLFTVHQREVLKKFASIDPREYGFRGPYYGLHEPPRNLVAIRGQRYRRGKEREEKKVITQYAPRHVADAWRELNGRMKEEIGKELLVVSGYRSPTYQLLVFVNSYVRNNGCSIARTARYVTLPGYSEHGNPARQALDFGTKRGTYNGHFSRTQEYRWLVRNAKQFGFMFSYPRNNKVGVAYEPWHWRYCG